MIQIKRNHLGQGELWSAHWCHGFEGIDHLKLPRFQGCPPAGAWCWLTNQAWGVGSFDLDELQYTRAS
jgi:hypothetical protein